MLDRFLSRWRGVAITLVIVVGVGELAATDQLGIYIHPRYFVFTVVTCAIAGVGCILAALLLPAATADHREDDHGHDHAPVATGRTRTALRAGATVAVIAGVTAVLLLPARALSADIAATRSGDSLSTGVTRPVDLSRLSSADYASFGLKDWSGLLAQGASASFLAGKTADLQGFVMPDPHGSDAVFLLTRLTITCCAVDAQPVSIPVRVPDWASRWTQGQWVSVEGGFVTNPDSASPETVVLDPSDIASIAEPAQPYAY